MRPKVRNGFVATLAINLAATILPVTPAMSTEIPQAFVHHVYFWLKRPADIDDRTKLIEGLKALSNVTTIKSYHIGVPSTTSRDVIDRSYSVSWMLTFADKADQDAYQSDPIHLRFVDEYSPLWDRVIVYDSEAVE